MIYLGSQPNAEITGIFNEFADQLPDVGDLLLSLLSERLRSCSLVTETKGICHSIAAHEETRSRSTRKDRTSVARGQ